jgi:hypothetical protein
LTSVGLHCVLDYRETSINPSRGFILTNAIDNEVRRASP